MNLSKSSLLFAMLGFAALPLAAQTFSPTLQAAVGYSYSVSIDPFQFNETTGPTAGVLSAIAQVQDRRVETFVDKSVTPFNTIVHDATVDLHATASFARLHASASAWLSSTEDPIHMNDGRTAGFLFDAGAASGFNDLLEVTGIQPAGTRVPLTAWVYVDAHLASSAVGSCGEEAYRPVSASGSLQIPSLQLQLSALRDQCNGQALVSQTFEATVGESFEVQGRLAAKITSIGTSTDQLGTQSTSAVADASHTGYFFFTSSVEGVGVLAMSGSDYSRPNIAMVPEPGEWAMLLAGLALVAGLVRRRGRRDGGAGQGARVTASASISTRYPSPTSAPTCSGVFAGRISPK